MMTWHVTKAFVTEQYGSGTSPHRSLLLLLFGLRTTVHVGNA